MKFLKFLFTARMSFLLFALLAFAITLLYLGWASHRQTPGAARPASTSEAR